jgi:putative radical SAM enzyme (TIGR03279 family)
VKTPVDSLPEISEVLEASAGARYGLQTGDRIVTVNGVIPRDILEWHRLVDDDEVDLHIVRGRDSMDIQVLREPGEPLGVSISSAVFDRIHTCDNHCEFCFIYQLPKGMRRSLYVKDDDYRLSFLFGNFTTLTRFTESDLERVIDEKLSPLYVSVHSTDPHVRSEMLRNVRGGLSLRWMRLMLEEGIDIRAQIVVCPGVNDGEVLDNTLAGLLECYPQIESIALVPLGLSRFNTESRMRVHSSDEARHVIDIVEKWQSRYASVLGRQPIHLADEFYLVADVAVPNADTYGDYPMLEDGVGLVRSFMDAFSGAGPEVMGRHDGFFASVDVANPTDYTGAMNPTADTSLRVSRPVAVSVAPRPKKAEKTSKPLAIVTGAYGAQMFTHLMNESTLSKVTVVEVVNEHFGGNTAVAGLMTYSDISATLRRFGSDFVYLLPDVCLNGGVFLDGARLDDLQQEFDVEVIPTSGTALRRRIEAAHKESADV